MKALTIITLSKNDAGDSALTKDYSFIRTNIDWGN